MGRLLFGPRGLGRWAGLDGGMGDLFGFLFFSFLFFSIPFSHFFFKLLLKNFSKFLNQLLNHTINQKPMHST
jgi:hypothetical protein